MVSEVVLHGQREIAAPSTLQLSVSGQMATMVLPIRSVPPRIRAIRRGQSTTSLHSFVLHGRDCGGRPLIDIHHG